MPPVPQSRYWMFAAMAVLGFVADLVSKNWIFGRLGMPGEQRPIWIIDGVFSLETSLNEGALFGLGAGWGIVFVLLSMVAIGGIILWVFRGQAAADRLLTFALGCITGGILGNLWDRLGLPGLEWTPGLKPSQAGESVYAVRDFIHFQYGAFDWPIFNLADSLLVCGVAMLVFQAYVLEPRKPADKDGGE